MGVEVSRPRGGRCGGIHKKEEEERKQAKLAKLSNGAVFPVLPTSTLPPLTGSQASRLREAESLRHMLRDLFKNQLKQ